MGRLGEAATLNRRQHAMYKDGRSIELLSAPASLHRTGTCGSDRLRMTLGSQFLSPNTQQLSAPARA